MVVSLQYISDVRKCFKEDLNALRIELRALAVFDYLQRLINRECRLVHTCRCKRIENIRHSHDSRRQRDLFTLQAFGITLAVPALVMVCGHVTCFGEIATAFYGSYRLLDYLLACCRMSLHDLIFFGCKLAWLIEHGIGYPDLADVMERRRLNCILDVFGGELVEIVTLAS